ncbi:MAG: hypothetical protein WCT07_01795 [Candidatus Paceibacterota bacterium]|jgi:hypothetical protein
MKEILLLLHPTFGVLGIIAAVWVIVEVINSSQSNQSRIRIASVMIFILMVLTWITGGYFYVFYYAADKAIILNGPWPFAHSLLMESKEHIFFMTLVLSAFLPIVSRMKNIITSRQTRILIISTATLIVISGLALEGAGAIIAAGAKLGLLQTVVQ